MSKTSHGVTESGVWLLTTQMPIKRQIDRKGSLLYSGCWPLGMGVGEVWALVQRLNSPPPPDNQRARVFMDRGRGLHADTAH